MSIRFLSSELQEKAEKELNEVPKRIQGDLEHIRDWIAKQPHLNVRTDDQWLLNYLRGCKFSLQRTKEKLDMFSTMRSLLPEFFTNRDPFQPELQEILDLGVFLPLPNTADPSGPRIILARCKPADPKLISFTTAMKVCLMITDILLNEDDNFVIAGQVGLMDFKGMTIEHAIQATPSLCKKLITCLQDAYPSRPKEFYVINSSSFVETIFNFIKPFLKDKLTRRIFFHSDGNFNKAHKAIPPSVLPKEYGGKGPSLDELTRSWKKKVESYRDWFVEDSQFCADEENRIGDVKTSECIFGIQGSFRKLDID